MKKALSKIAGLALDLLFPPRCLICGEVVPLEAAACEECVRAVYAKHLSKERCEVCGKHREDCVCGGKAFCFESCICAFSYDKTTYEFFRVIKSGRGDKACREAARLMAEAFRASPLAADSFDYITEVPMNQSKLLLRGYNQAKVLAEILSDILQIKYLPTPLYQTEDYKLQHRLSASERRKNAAYSYRLKKGVGISGTVLLIDDIMTTGVTLDCCAGLLLKAGAQRVCCLTAATTPKRVALLFGQNAGN